MSHQDTIIQDYSFNPNLSEETKALFKAFGKNSRIASPFEATNPQCVEIGDYVSINRDMRLTVLTDLTRIIDYIGQHYPEHKPEAQAHEQDYQFPDPKVYIGDCTSFGRYCFITATNHITIGKAVIFSERVYISDTEHRFDNPDLPIIFQSMTKQGKTIIGDHSWIGIGACILNAKLGKHCVIGANSVVISDIPDYTVAAGIPAKPIKTLNPKTGKWERIANHDQ